MRYFLSLGSNLGDKRKNIAQALGLLAQGGVEVLRASSLYRTQPVDYKEQPWFYNQVVEVSTPLNPYDLLRLTKGIEKRMGRKPTRLSGPRPIDIDILLAENWVIQTKRLVIPHPRMQKRNFVLIPFREISPGTTHPVLKKKISELKKKSADSSGVRKLRSLKSENKRALSRKSEKKTSKKRQGGQGSLRRRDENMRKAVLLFLFLAILALPGLSLEIKGKVVSVEGKPIPKAVILNRAGGQQTLSDEGGSFSLTVSGVERVVLEVIHPDYMEEEVSLTAKSLSRPVTITLTPYIRQREEVVVTAMRYPEPSAKVPAASTVVTAERLKEKMAPNIAEGLKDLPGVSELGSGGFSLVPSIRGLARRRVLLMIDNARLSSDRRTGPSASFISPEDIERIEVLRSPSSVFYGSDAMGGVVHILTRKPKVNQGIRGRINSKYGTVNEEKGLGFSLSGGKSNFGYAFSLQGIDANNYRSPSGEVLQSQFTQSSFLGKISYQTEKREVEGSFLIARGKNIGKPNRDSATKPTWYPRENQNLVQLHWREKEFWGGGDFNLHVYINPNFLETESKTIPTIKTKESYGKTQSTDFGAQISFDKKVANSLRLTGGADVYGRTDARAINRDKYFDDQGNVTRTFEETPYTNGKRDDVGFFISADYDGVRGLDLVGGLRLDFLYSRAYPGGRPETVRSKDEALTGFLAGSVKLAERVVWFANVSRAFRAPDLNELYYTGITGRGFIIANPNLTPESSLNFETGVKFIDKRFFAGLYAFNYGITDMIERYLVQPKVYTYGNIAKGRIHGVELEWEYFPWSGLSVFGNLQFINGKSKETGDPLNDIPAQRLFLGTRAWVGRFSFEVNGTLRQKKDNPGPAEIPIPAVQYVNLKASYFFAPSVNIYFVLSNLFNETFLGRPDPEAMEEPGRNFLFGISYSF